MFVGAEGLRGWKGPVTVAGWWEEVCPCHLSCMCCGGRSISSTVKASDLGSGLQTLDEPVSATIVSVQCNPGKQCWLDIGSLPVTLGFFVLAP